MSYFDDLALVWGDEYPACRAQVDRRFADVCSIQLSLGGPLFFGIDHQPPLRTDGPLFFWHHPAAVYQYGSLRGKSWHHLWVSFRGPRALRLMERGFMPLATAGCFSPTHTSWAAQTMRELIAMSRAPEESRTRAVVLLEELLLWAEAEIQGATLGQSASSQKVRRIIDEIQLRPDRRFDFPAAAARAGLSFSHFRTLFREATGQAPLAYALQRLMEQAAADLADTRLTIGEIGERAAYPDQAQFSKAFRKIMGVSPQAFRREVLLRRGRQLQ
jgi:AraC-like DNA-binding protein